MSTGLADNFPMETSNRCYVFKRTIRFDFDNVMHFMKDDEKTHNDKPQAQKLKLVQYIRPKTESNLQTSILVEPEIERL